jgi:hypothetical protein
VNRNTLILITLLVLVALCSAQMLAHEAKSAPDVEDTLLPSDIPARRDPPQHLTPVNLPGDPNCGTGETARVRWAPAVCSVVVAPPSPRVF